MSVTQERKQREMAAREQLFLETARKLIAEEGLLPLQMARLAEACEYSTGTLYQHFTSKEDLLVALAAWRAREYSDLFLRAADWSASSRDRMFALAVIDHTFCQDNPDHSQLIQYVFTEVVWTNASKKQQTEMTAACRPCIKAVNKIVEEAVEIGDLPATNLLASEVSLGPWALCHGVQSLLHTKGLLESMDINRAGELLFLHFQTLLNGMRWKPLVDPAKEKEINALVRKVQKEVMQYES